MRRLALPATVRLAFLATATVLLVGRASLAVEDGAPTPAQLRSKIGALLAQYRNPKLDLDKRGEIVRELFELGEEGVRRAVPELARDFAARHKAYPTKFAKAAEKVMAKRAKAREFKQEVDRLRKEVLAVSRDPNLTKEKIIEQADPARRRLEELLSLSPEDVLESDESLRQDRDTLLQALRWWREGADKLPADAERADKRNAPPAPPEPDAFEKELADADALAATVAAVPDRVDRTTFHANRELAKQLDPAEARGVLALNLLRARLGLGALAIDPRLCEASRGHAKDMAEQNFFGHTSPVPGKATPWDRAKLAGTAAAAENIYNGTDSGEDAVASWWHSPAHHVNLTGPYKRLGLGRHGDRWTLMLGG